MYNYLADFAQTFGAHRVALPAWLGRALHKAQAAKLAKGASHKYIRRIPKAGGGFRYFYAVTGGHGLGHHDEFVKGAAFKVKDAGHEGHFHVEEDHGEEVTLKHDESGKSARVSKRALASMLHAEHAEAVGEMKKRAAQTLEQAKKTGTAKQQEKAAALASKYHDKNTQERNKLEDLIEKINAMPHGPERKKLYEKWLIERDEQQKNKIWSEATRMKPPAAYRYIMEKIGKFSNFKLSTLRDEQRRKEELERIIAAKFKMSPDDFEKMRADEIKKFAKKEIYYKKFGNENIMRALDLLKQRFPYEKIDYLQKILASHANITHSDVLRAEEHSWAIRTVFDAAVRGESFQSAYNKGVMRHNKLTREDALDAFSDGKNYADDIKYSGEE